jgi:hypothetical protein
MKLGERIQLIGSILVLSGIIIEIIYKADLGFLSITIGSFIWAIGAKLSHSRRRRRR